MKEIEKYIGYYLFTYLFVLAVCGFFQYMYKCQGQSLSCAFSLQGINTIITTTAYVLTPMVAIIGFFSWKSQHNKLVLSNEAKEALLSIHYDLELMANISGPIRRIHPNTLIGELDDNQFIDLTDHVFELNKNITSVSSKVLVLYELTHDEALLTLSKNYQKSMITLTYKMIVILDDKDNYTIGNLLNIIDLNMQLFFDMNKNYKRELKNYIVAE